MKKLPLLLVMVLSLGCHSPEDPGGTKPKRVKTYFHPSRQHAELFRHVLKYRNEAIPAGSHADDYSLKQLADICREIPAVAEKPPVAFHYIIAIPGNDCWAVVEDPSADMLWDGHRQGWHVYNRDETRWLPANVPHTIIRKEVWPSPHRRRRVMEDL